VAAWPWGLAALCWLAGTVGGGLFTLWAWGYTEQLHHPNYYASDLVDSILNAGGVLRYGGLTHLYGGNGHLLVALPGFELVLVAVARVVTWFGLPAPGLGLGMVGGIFFNYATGGTWVAMVLVAYALGMAAIFPLVALARRLGVGGGRLAFLTVAMAGALWWTTELWGHPEDALAVGLLAWAVLYALDRRWRGMGWLIGVGLAVQPLGILALPCLLVLAGARRWLMLLPRIVLPGLASVIVPLIGDPSDTLRQVVQQPTYPNGANAKLTPWIGVVPHVHQTTVYGGWPRAVSLGLALVVALGLAHVVVRAGRVDPAAVVWAVAVALSLRWAFEAVFFPFYLVPALVFFLLAAATSGPWRLGATFAGAGTVAYLSGWRTWSPWGYEGLLLCAMAVLAVVTIPAAVREALRTPAAEPAPVLAG
jgi:hypothetical protein